MLSQKNTQVDVERLLKSSKSELITLILQKEGIMIPLSVLSSGLHPLQAVVKYLREEESLPMKQIALLLNRNIQTIWTSYNHVRHVPASSLSSSHHTQLSIPLSILSKEDASILESTVHYLHQVQGMSLTKIAQALGKSVKTVWTCNHRYLIKGGIQQ